MDFRDRWNVEMAMQVLVSESVDSETWTEAVKWLMLYGPLELRQLLLDASSHATNTYFPELKPASFSREGEPLYRTDHIADALGADPEELRETLDRSQRETKTVVLHDEEDAFKIQ